MASARCPVSEEKLSSSAGFDCPKVSYTRIFGNNKLFSLSAVAVSVKDVWGQERLPTREFTEEESCKEEHCWYLGSWLQP